MKRATKQQSETATQPLSDDEKVLAEIRRLDETVIHKRIVEPLLYAMGARHIRYVHGPTERGKDFIYLTPGMWGTDKLTVCQVKNAPFSGKASDQGNTTSTITQLIQCRITEVLHPVSNTKQLPHQIVLVTTYPLPDKDVADASTLLDEVVRSNCEVISPETLVRQLHDLQPTIYRELLHPGDGGLRDALRKYLTLHHEVVAFDLEPGRSRFFVNLGITNAGNTVTDIENSSASSLTTSFRAPA